MRNLKCLLVRPLQILAVKEKIRGEAIDRSIDPIDEYSG